jgi:ribosomal protein S18 acetylase RimI-like enzyme
MIFHIFLDGIGEIRKNSAVILHKPANLVTTALRPEGPEDEPFLLELYAGTRQEELEATGWPAAMREAFVRMQFNAQRQGYRAAYPRAQFSIILCPHPGPLPSDGRGWTGGQAVGRIVIDRAEKEFLLVDVVLLPAHRGRGIGTALMQDLLREAAAARKPVRLSVLKGQRAFRLYQRLGFEKTGEDALRDQMEWRGDRLPPNDPNPCAPA